MLALIELLLMLGGLICLVLAVFGHGDRLRWTAAGLALWLLAELVQHAYAVLR
ncbi:hypothetical protein ABZ860_11455 [Microbispora sp. NPDC046973]|uniref:hypothetical protein n=1 Tax=Microbispora sp. NPDC046973 TaxID=3155022 RepID=UPI0034023FA9